MRFLYIGKTGRARSIIERDQVHQTASNDTFFNCMITEHDLEVRTLVASKAPPDASPVLFR
jgi:hypothetical protein